MKYSDIDVYAAQADVLGEGPIWSTAEQALYWLDIAEKSLYRKAPHDARPCRWSLSEHPGCLAELDPGAIALAMGEGIQRFSLESADTNLLLAVPRRRVATRFNDGKVDPSGRFWVSSMPNNYQGEKIDIAQAAGNLYRCDPDGSVHLMEENTGVPNTLAWSPNLKHFYFADSLRRQIYVYDFDVTLGTIHNKRLLFDTSNYGIPDGSAIDVDGCLWNACLDCGALLRITPNGELDLKVELPVPRPTSCIFGGANLDVLFVTSAREGVSEEELARFPLSGSIFAIAGKARGVSVPPFAWAG
jgi:sugar lactone lactonase YvrE